ncbi:hypothetical protein [Rubellimicrobium rubrum]|uniref:hypothetical protein n=1 Tax=Rubellimicrobium rubrum TaxID=2585369 RepID=UPI00159BB6B3|nr:hypothetical protein [Rubellimicrobium rubrum]
MPTIQSLPALLAAIRALAPAQFAEVEAALRDARHRAELLVGWTRPGGSGAVPGAADWTGSAGGGPGQTSSAIAAKGAAALGRG